MLLKPWQKKSRSLTTLIPLGKDSWNWQEIILKPRNMQTILTQDNIWTSLKTIMQYSKSFKKLSMSYWKRRGKSSRDFSSFQMMNSWKFSVKLRISRLSSLTWESALKILSNWILIILNRSLQWSQQKERKSLLRTIKLEVMKSNFGLRILKNPWNIPSGLWSVKHCLNMKMKILRDSSGSYRSLHK